MKNAMQLKPVILPNELFELIEKGECCTVEFKKSTTNITKDVYDTVCSFSDRDGGHIFLGVKDNGMVLGIQTDRIDCMKKDFVTAINNENKMYPPLYLTPIEYEYDGKVILYIRIPVSPSVCRCSGRIYDRNHESDIDITNNAYEVYRLYARKNGSYFVNKVTRFGIDSLRPDLIERARKMAQIRGENHPWRSMTDEEMLHSAGLILTDEYTQQEGITIAAILLFGKDSTIMSVLPQHKTDAIFRVQNVDRYDDRDVVSTNLIESYDRLFSFGQKHLNDTFHLDGIQSISARDHILREIISNLLAHRDFTSGYVAKMVIERTRLYTENASLSHGHGMLNLATFDPFQKNPPISKIFREIGLSDELGSGMRNTYKYAKMYSGKEPIFEEGDTFCITVPLSEIATTTVGPNTYFPADGEINGEINGGINEEINEGMILSETEKQVLSAIRKNPYIRRTEMMVSLGISKSTLDRALKKLKEVGVLERVGPKKTGHWKIVDH